MKIVLCPKHPPVEPINVTKASSQEFADLLRELEKKGEFKKIDGSFSIYRNQLGIVIDLDFETQ